MTKNQVHEWHETRPEGGKRYYRAHWDSREWRFTTTTPEDEDWLPVEKPELELWEALRDVLFRKYQRKRLHYRLLESVDKILALVREGKELPKPKVSERMSPSNERFRQRRRGDR